MAKHTLELFRTCAFIKAYRCFLRRVCIALTWEGCTHTLWFNACVVFSVFIWVRDYSLIFYIKGYNIRIWIRYYTISFSEKTEVIFLLPHVSVCTNVVRITCDVTRWSFNYRGKQARMSPRCTSEELVWLGEREISI